MKKFRAFLLILIVALALPSAAFATVESTTISSQIGDMVTGPLSAYTPLGDDAWASAPQTAGTTAWLVAYPDFGAMYIAESMYPNPALDSINTWRLYHKEFVVDCENASGVLSVNSDNAEEAYLNGVLIGTDGLVNSTELPRYHEPGQPDVFEWTTIQTYTVSLQPGLNTMDFIVRNYASTASNPTALAYKLEYSCPLNTAPDLAINQIADQAVVSIGYPMGFTITVTNNGDATASNVTLSDPLPVITGVNWSVGGTDAAACTLSAGVLSCNFGNMLSDAVKTIHISASEYPWYDKCFGTLINTATLMADNQPVNKTATASIEILCPYLYFDIVSDTFPVQVVAGNPVNLIFTIDNLGDGKAKAVEAYLSIRNAPGMSWSITEITPVSVASNCAITREDTWTDLDCFFDEIAPLDGVSIKVTSPTTFESCGSIEAGAGAIASNSLTKKSKGFYITVTCPVGDTTSPVITPTITGTQGANGWYTGNVSLTWAVSDPESAVSSSSGCADVQVTQDQVATSYTCSATSAGGTASNTVSIARDATAPIITCPASANVSSGQTVTAGVDAAVSGLDESASTLSGTLGSVFPQTLSFTAVDLAGNAATKACTFNTGYNFSGFYQPVENPGPGPNYIFNSLKAGAAVPVRFSLAGNQGLSIFTSGYPTSQAASCTTAAATDPIEETVSAGNSTLIYDAASDTYTYVWKTDKKWVGTCRALTVKFNDGLQYLAYFHFK